MDVEYPRCSHTSCSNESTAMPVIKVLDLVAPGHRTRFGGRWHGRRLAVAAWRTPRSGPIDHAGDVLSKLGPGTVAYRFRVTIEARFATVRSDPLHPPTPIGNFG